MSQNIVYLRKIFMVYSYYSYWIIIFYEFEVNFVIYFAKITFRQILRIWALLLAIIFFMHNLLTNLNSKLSTKLKILSRRNWGAH